MGRLVYSSFPELRHTEKLQTGDIDGRCLSTLEGVHHITSAGRDHICDLTVSCPSEISW